VNFDLSIQKGITPARRAWKCLPAIFRDEGRQRRGRDGQCANSRSFQRCVSTQWPGGKGRGSLGAPIDPPAWPGCSCLTHTFRFVLLMDARGGIKMQPQSAPMTYSVREPSAMSSESFMTPVARNQTKSLPSTAPTPKCWPTPWQVLPLRALDARVADRDQRQRAEQFLNHLFIFNTATAPSPTWPMSPCPLSAQPAGRHGAG